MWEWMDGWLRMEKLIGVKEGKYINNAVRNIVGVINQ